MEHGVAHRASAIAVGMCLIVTGICVVPGLHFDHAGNSRSIPTSASSATPPPSHSGGFGGRIAFSGRSEAGNITLGLPGANPNATAIDKRTGDILVLLGPSYLDVVSPASGSVIATINLGADLYPIAVAFDSATNEIYVTTLYATTNATLNATSAGEGNEVVVVSGLTYAIVAHVLVGINPWGIVYDNLTGDIWVVNGGLFYANGTASPELTVINGSNHVVVANLRVYAEAPTGIGFDYRTRDIIIAGIGFTLFGYVVAVNDTTYSVAWVGCGGQFQSSPDAIAYDLRTGEVYVLLNEGDLFVYNGATGQSTAEIRLGGSLVGLSYDNRSGMMYVTNYGANAVSVINGSTYTIVGNIKVKDGPGGAAYSYRSDSVYVADTQSQAVSVINTTAADVSNTIRVSASPVALVEDSALQAIVVTGADQVLAISDRNGSIVGSAAVGLNPEGIAYDNQTDELYVTNAGSNSVTVLSGSNLTVTDTISVGNYPQGIAYDGATSQIFVACAGSNVVDVISPASHSVVARIGVGLGPTELAVDPALSELFVTEYDNDSVSVISTQSMTLVGSIPLSYFSAPVGIALDPSTDQLYVADSFRSSVSIISAANRSVVGNVTVGGAPFDVVFDPNSDLMLVSNACAVTGSPASLVCNSNVTILSTSLREVVGSVVTGDSPLGEAFSPTTGNVYVANFYSGTVTVLTPIPPPAYSVTFEESGLVSGAAWSVTLGGVQEPAVAPSPITFAQPNGTYSYSVTPVPGYTTAYQGQVDVLGNTTVFVTFELFTYAATFRETGLPSGTSWSVNLNGSIEKSNSTTITFHSLANGSYEFSVAGVSGYTANDTAGTILVNGSSVTAAINFVANQPSGTLWLYVGIAVAAAAVGAAAAGTYLLRRRGPRARTPE